MKHGEYPLEHAFLLPTMDPRYRQCVNCKAVGKVEITKPALAQEHSETSKDAARKIEPARDSLRTKVLEAIKKAGPAGIERRMFVHGDGHPDTPDDSAYGIIEHERHGGLTDEEGIAITGIPASTYRPRRVELVEANLVYDSGLTRPTKSGRRATIWVAR